MTLDASLTARARIAARAVATFLVASLVAAVSLGGAAGASSAPFGGSFARPIASTLSPDAKTKVPCRGHGKHAAAAAVAAPCPGPEVLVKPSWSGYIVNQTQIG